MWEEHNEENYLKHYCAPFIEKIHTLWEHCRPVLAENINFIFLLTESAKIINYAKRAIILSCFFLTVMSRFQVRGYLMCL
jgi:hypothetical protein